MAPHPNCRQGLESQLTEAFGCLCSTQGWRLTQAHQAPTPGQEDGPGGGCGGRGGERKGAGSVPGGEKGGSIPGQGGGRFLTLSSLSGHRERGTKSMARAHASCRVAASRLGRPVRVRVL